MAYADPTTKPLAHHTLALPRAKRVLDIGLTVLGLLALWPVFLAIALAVRLTSRGPVFFVQQRVGQGGKAFGMIKFRSMVADAEALLPAQSDRDGICFKQKDDPRITAVGRFLRKSSLDEVPQLINVLKGEMSLVGPRPALPQEVAQYPARALGRLAVLPGITGLWQVSGRADLDFDDMVTLDLSYARNPTLWRDIAILWRTVGVVLSGRGAY